MELARRGWEFAGRAEGAFKRSKTFFDPRQTVTYIEPWPEHFAVTLVR
jgi:hypothetical protein